MNAHAPRTAQPPSQAGLAAQASVAASSARALAARLLLTACRTLTPAQREAHFIAARAEWPLLLSRMAEIEAAAPNAANVGYLADAELMDVVDDVRARPGVAAGAPTPAEAAAFALDLSEALAFVATPHALRQHVRWALDDAFTTWPKLCRRMSALLA